MISGQLTRQRRFEQLERTRQTMGRQTDDEVLAFMLEEVPKMEAHDAIQEQWIRLLQYKHPGIFGAKFGPKAGTCGATHAIITTGRPFKTRAYRTSPQAKEILKREIDTMLEGVIRPMISPYSSGVVMVPKKDGTTQVCIDFRKLNEQTKKDTYPLPLMEELLEKIAGCEKYTTLDLASGYWQIPMEEESIPKTAFTCKFGTFEYTVMPFGLTNAPATFQRVMDTVLAKFI
jgi:hypothetical protein